MKKLIVLAVVLRILVAAFYFHPDIKTYHFQSSFLRSGVLNIYTYLIDNRKTLPFKEEFVYFPLTYFTLGGYQFIAQPLLGPSFDSWLYNAQSAVADPHLFRYLLILKIPYLILDVLIAVVLMKFFDSKEDAKKALIFWLFNPFTIFLIYAYGNIDIIPVFLTLLAFLKLKQKKFVWASILLGIAAGFKIYPLLFVPFLFAAGRAFPEKVKLAVIPAAIFFTISLPFLSPQFLSSALASGLTTRAFTGGLGLLGLIILFFKSYYYDPKVNLLHYWVAIFLIIFAFSHFHISWLLWIAPFMILLLVRKQVSALALFTLALSAFAIPLLYKDRAMTWGLLRGYSTLFDLLPIPYYVVLKFYDVVFIQNMVRVLFAAGAVFMAYKLTFIDSKNTE